MSRTNIETSYQIVPPPISDLAGKENLSGIGGKQKQKTVHAHMLYNTDECLHVYTQLIATSVCCAFTVHDVQHMHVTQWKGYIHVHVLYMYAIACYNYNVHV